MQAAACAIDHVPGVALHARQMQWFRRLNALDLETAKPLLRTGPRSWEWIASWPLSVATAISALYPEVFNDHTGTGMRRFLTTDEGEAYRIPGSKL